MQVSVAASVPFTMTRVTAASWCGAHASAGVTGCVIAGIAVPYGTATAGAGFSRAWPAATTAIPPATSPPMAEPTITFNMVTPPVSPAPRNMPERGARN